MNWPQLIVQETKAICTNSAIFLTVFIGVVFYSFLYPQPYANQVPREISLVVANLDNSQLSRKLERMVDASPQVRIVERTGSIEDARNSFSANRYGGILVIPENFYKDIQMGVRPTLAYGGDASYFLVYGTVLEGLSLAGATLGAELKVAQKLVAGLPLEGAIQEISPVELKIAPVFNSTLAYLNYVLPAVFLLILHHTLIIATGLLSGEQRGQKGYWSALKPQQLLLVRALVFCAIYTLLFCYYYGICLDRYEVPHIGSIPDLFFILAPFLLSCVFLGICLGKTLPQKEYVTVIVLLSSLVLVFSTGFVWPIENVPTIIAWLVYLSPFSAAVQAFLRVNQMGSDLGGVAHHLAILWTLVFVYGCLAYYFLQKESKAQPLDK